MPYRTLLFALVSGLMVNESASAQCAWEAGPTLPGLSRTMAAGVDDSGTLTVLGGRPLVGGEIAPVHYLPPAASVWSTGTSIDFIINDPGAGIDPNGAIVVFGGWNVDLTGGGFFARLNGFFYDTAGGEGDGIANFSCSRARFAYATDNLNRFYAMGGRDEVFTVEVIEDCVERYDPVADAWGLLNPLPSPRTNAAGVYDGAGHILVIGGANAAGVSQSTVFSYDISTDLWSTINSLPVAYQGQRAVLGADGRVYTIGGFASNANFPTTAVYIYDPGTGLWSTGPSLTTARHGTAVALRNDGYIYAMGGSGGSGTNTVEKLNTNASAGDCNTNGIPDTCEPDCNLNGSPDDCDITDLISADCNSDGVPDECEIDQNSTAPGGPFYCTIGCDPDCNDNGVPDDCDIAAGGGSADLNGNGVPDECDECITDADCSDNDVCTGLETCNVAVCVSGVSLNCNDFELCTDDSCDAVIGCVNTPNNANSCEDGVVCNGTETCQGGTCVPGVPIPGCCKVDSQCDNTVFCDGAEQCINNACVSGTSPSCSDGFACTFDECSAATDACTHTPDHGACDDFDPCTTDICEPPTGDPTTGCLNTAVDVDDGVTCTVDACDPVTGAITHAPDHGACDDFDPCTTDTCDPLAGDPTTGCLNTAVDVDDGVTCTVDACNPVTGAITHAPDHGVCANSIFCDGVETCDAVLGCMPGDDPCFGVMCDEANDVCANDIPTVSEWGLLAMSLTLLALGTVLLSPRNSPGRAVR